ncbi:MAG: dihydrodipicolinate reductase [Pseudomonadota bacterium]
MMRRLITIAALVFGMASPAFADFRQVTSKDAFTRLIEGKTLTRPLVKINVLPDGRITGNGASWEVTGEWSWQDGYLCRSLFWGGDDLGYNCQEVRTNGSKVRITSDRGTGRSADFRLR